MNKIYYDLLLLLVAIIWGSGFVAADIALEQLPPITITALRFTVATILFYIVQFRKLKNMRPLLIPGLIIGTFLALGFIFQTIGLNYTTPSKNAFLTSTNVIITPFIYFLFLRKKITSKTILGSFIALVGIGILNFNENLIYINNKGDILTLICALFFAFHILFTGYFLKDRKCDLSIIIFLQFLFAALISWIFVFIVEGISIDYQISNSFISVLYLGIFSTLVCFFLQNFAQRKVDQNKTAIILSLEALFGTIFSILLRDEHLTTNMIIGFILLFSAILIIEAKIPKRRSKRKYEE